MVPADSLHRIGRKDHQREGGNKGKLQDITDSTEAHRNDEGVTEEPGDSDDDGSGGARRFSWPSAAEKADVVGEE